MTMDVELDLRKTVWENAQKHYEYGKKAKSKIPGLAKSMKKTVKELEELSLSQDVEEEKILVKKRKRAWFEKYRWFESSDGMLVIGGRDATTNDILIKKHLEVNDLVFHADIQGAPFFVVKNPDGIEVPNQTLQETAQAAASYSSAWKTGWGSCDVYYVDPEQVSKTPPSGEYLPKGAFMIYGEKKWFKKTVLQVAVGFQDSEPHVIGGPVSAVKKNCIAYVLLTPGDDKAGVLSKRIGKKFKDSELEDFILNEIQYWIPAGTGRIEKE